VQAGHGDPEVRAAGGVIFRDGRVVVVHRPRYDDWSLPKGKAELGESDEACALREVEEETGLRCDLGAELSTARYRDAKRRPKRIRWWVMRPVSGEFVPTDEVDELRWLTPDDARALLSYSSDVAVLDEAVLVC
jgi:8-oxo-dGTP diphosphatase